MHSELPPSDLEHLNRLIAGRAIVLSDGFRQVVEVGLRRPDIIAFGTATSIAADCNVSATTVIRLTKMLGFSSLRQFKRMFHIYLCRAP